MANNKNPFRIIKGGKNAPKKISAEDKVKAAIARIEQNEPLHLRAYLLKMLERRFPKSYIKVMSQRPKLVHDEVLDLESLLEDVDWDEILDAIHPPE